MRDGNTLLSARALYVCVSHHLPMPHRDTPLGKFDLNTFSRPGSSTSGVRRLHQIFPVRRTFTAVESVELLSASLDRMRETGSGDLKITSMATVIAKIANHWNSRRWRTDFAALVLWSC